MERDRHFEQVWRHAVLEPIPPETRSSVAIYADTRLFSAGEPLPVPHQQWRAPQPGWLVFVDMVPQANWGHPCRYILLSSSTGEALESREAEFPPPTDFLQLLYAGKALEPWMLLV